MGLAEGYNLLWKYLDAFEDDPISCLRTDLTLTLGLKLPVGMQDTRMVFEIALAELARLEGGVAL